MAYCARCGKWRKIVAQWWCKVCFDNWMEGK